ncbi:MAG: sugar ABC transporter ATP-binding protein [Verrucomicrobiota bacterium]|nr:sugar ABC transporter ATP-binding protein [Verrucomicrobiota bacterium]
MMLQVERLTKRFPGVVALDAASFDLRAGEVHALCGENGAGKSTLIKCLSGVYPHNSYEGAIRLDGNDVAFNSIAEAERVGISVIYQELALVPELTVAENIFLGHEPVRRGFIDWNRMFARAHELFARYGIDLDPAAKAGQLGIGRQQLVEIFKALAKNSRVLLLDEPTAALTGSEVEILFGIVRQLRERGLGCIYISHKLDEIFQLSDRVTIFRDGRSISTHVTGEIDRAEVIRRMVGRDIADQYPRQPVPPGKIVLEVRNLGVTDETRGRTILENISFQVRAGEVFGLGGLMGAGRTELLMHLMGACGRRIRGTVNIGGQNLPANASTSEIMRRGMVLVSEERRRYGYVPGTSVGFNLSLAALGRFSRNGWVDARAEAAASRIFFEKMRVKAPGLQTRIDMLSGGNQQKVVLGKSLMAEPEVILLDEPTRGIDVGAKLEIYHLVNQLSAEGKAVVLVSSEMPELMGMSDRILVLSDGRCGGTFERNAFNQEALMEAAMVFHRRRTADFRAA